MPHITIVKKANSRTQQTRKSPRLQQPHRKTQAEVIGGNTLWLWTQVSNGIATLGQQIQAATTAIKPAYHHVADWVLGKQLSFEQDFIRRLQQEHDAVIETQKGYIIFEIKKMSNGKMALGIVNEAGNVEVFTAPWKKKLERYLQAESLTSKAVFVEYGDLHEVWNEQDFAAFKQELAEAKLITQSNGKTIFEDQEIGKTKTFPGFYHDFEADLYLKWANRYGRPSPTGTSNLETEEPKTMWDAMKTITIAGLAIGSSLGVTSKIISWVQDVQNTTGTMDAAGTYTGLVPYTGFDASSFAMGILGTALTYNPLWMGLSLLNYKSGAYGQLVNGTIPNQTATVYQPFNLIIDMSELFGDSAENITFSQVNGNPLPAWLSVNIEPVLKGNYSSSPLCYISSAAIISDNMAYVVEYEDGYVAGNLAPVQVRFRIIDVSDPTNPILKGSLNITGKDDYAAEYIVISGNVAYVTVSDSFVWNGLQIIDVSNVTKPVLKSSFGGYPGADSIVISGDMAYVLDGDSFQIIDVSNVTKPVLKGSLNIRYSYSLNMVISGNMAYVIDVTGYVLQIIDVSDPTNPILKSSFNITGYSSDVYVGNIVISGNMAYVPWLVSEPHDVVVRGFIIIDVSNVTKPVLKSSFNITGDSLDMVISGNMAYVTAQNDAGKEDGFQIIDVSNVTKPVLKGSYFAKVSGVYFANYMAAISGNMVYAIWSNGTVVSGFQGGGFQIIDVSNVTKPVLKGSYFANDLFLDTITISGNMAYTVVGDYLLIFDISSCWKFTGIPQLSDIGEIDVKITALNGTGMNISKVFTINIKANSNSNVKANSNSKASSNSLDNTLIIVGGVIGGLFAVLGIVIGTVAGVRHCKKKRRETPWVDKYELPVHKSAEAKARAAREAAEAKTRAAREAAEVRAEAKAKAHVAAETELMRNLSPQTKEAFIATIIKGDATGVEKFLKGGVLQTHVPPNFVCEAGEYQGKYPLHIAAAKGDVAIVDLLLAFAADVNKPGATNGETALHLAATNGHVSVVDKLLAASALVNKADTANGATALHLAAVNGHLPVIEKLLGAGAIVNSSDKNGVSPLMLAAWAGHLGVVKALVVAHANVLARGKIDGEEGYALDFARKKNHPEIIAYLEPVFCEIIDRQRREAEERVEQARLALLRKKLQVLVEANKAQWSVQTGNKLQLLPRDEQDALQSFIGHLFQIKPAGLDEAGLTESIALNESWQACLLALPQKIAVLAAEKAKADDLEARLKAKQAAELKAKQEVELRAKQAAEAKARAEAEERARAASEAEAKSRAEAKVNTRKIEVLQEKIHDFDVEIKTAFLTEDFRVVIKNCILGKEGYTKLAALGVDCTKQVEELDAKIKEAQAKLSMQNTPSHPVASVPMLNPSTSNSGSTPIYHPATGASPPSPPLLPPQGCRIIPYADLQINQALGSGGFGTVYRATWHTESVAVKKLFSAQLTTDASKEFIAEAEIMAKLDSQRLVRLRGVCVAPDPYCLVMEYMPKGSLYSLLHSGGQYNWPSLLQIASDTGEGLAFLHQERIIHRDLKSLNVLIDERDRAKIADFGLSRVKNESSKLQTKTIVGTMAYSAPELLNSYSGEDVPYGTASDIYAYGVILWEILTRQTPFDNLTPAKIIANVLQGRREKIPDTCPPAYKETIERCWAQEPTQRLPAAQVVQVLQAQRKAATIKSWHIDPALKPAGRTVEGFQYIVAGEYDARKVIEAYQRCPVPGMEVGRVTIIFNPTLNKSFADSLELLEGRAGNPAFQPKWQTEGGGQAVLDQRAAIIRRFEAMTAPYQDSAVPHVKILLVCHGTKKAIVKSIVKTGFANLATTDAGFFGKGLYSSYEAEYAYRVYGPGNLGADGVLLFSLLACHSAYPVVDGDMPKLEGKGNYGNYDAHIVPVRPANPNNPNEANYYPCRPGYAAPSYYPYYEPATYYEIVVFGVTQMLPRYIVELQPSLLAPMPPAVAVFAPPPLTTAPVFGSITGVTAGGEQQTKKTASPSQIASVFTPPLLPFAPPMSPPPQFAPPPLPPQFSPQTIAPAAAKFGLFAPQSQQPPSQYQAPATPNAYNAAIPLPSPK